MSQSFESGVALILVAGLMAGDCMLPLKFIRKWHWENTWLVFSLLSLVVLPWTLALVLVNHLFQTYNSLPASQFATPVLFGAGWGIAQVLFGISIQRLGLALAYAIVVGLGTLLGTLVPLFVQHRAQIGWTLLIQVLAGIVIMLVGIALSAWAGQIRECSEKIATAPSLGRYRAAVLVAVLCGILAPMLNYSFAFGQDIAVAAVRLGNPEVRAAYAVWPIGLAGGLLPNLGYSIYLLRRNRTGVLFRSIRPDGFWAASMATLWMGAFALYGMSATYLGNFGTSIGWGLFQIFMIMTATLSGVFTGEWKSAPRFARALLVMSITCLLGATTLLALANR
ncbi:MAG TPA: L-rhamnose/proton symporter RhaT [Terracidiphilus sp.]